MQEIVGCRGLQRPEGAHVAVPLEIGSNCLINQCLTTQTHSMESCDGNRSSGTIPDSVKLAKRFNAAEQFRRALLESRPFCPVLAATYSAWASSQRSIRSFAISERFELSIGSGPFFVHRTPPCAPAQTRRVRQQSKPGIHVNIRDRPWDGPSIADFWPKAILPIRHDQSCTLLPFLTVPG